MLNLIRLPLLIIFYLALTQALFGQSRDHVDFFMMNQEIRHTMEENGRQKVMFRKQTANTASETVNKEQWSSFKEVKTKIQKRLRFVDFALQAIPVGVDMYRNSQKIAQYQIALYEELEDAPYLITSVLPQQYDFVDDLQMVVRLLTGIVISYGAINQMERAERKILLDYAMDEVSRIKMDAYFILFHIREVKRKLRLEQAQWQFYINRDKQIVEEILTNINSL